MDVGMKALSQLLFESLFPPPNLTETLSECHVTSLHYASPSPVQREDWQRPLWGEEFMEGVEDAHLAHFKAPTSAVFLHPAGGRGTPFEESTFHVTPPPFLTKEEEFSPYPSSGLCWRDTQHVEGEACARSDDLFSGRCGHTVAVSSVEDRITDQKTLVLCCISCLLYSRELRVLVPAHLRKAAHPSHLF